MRGTTMDATRQLDLWPGMPGGRCPLCRARRPTPATCAKCALRIARVTTPQLTWTEERALVRRELVRLAAERTQAERAHSERLHRLGNLRHDYGPRRPVRVALVGCGAQKQPGRHQARALYTGPLFKAALAHAERSADEVLILSALHGVVGLDDELEAYDLRLDSYRDAERSQWAYRVLCELAKRYRGLEIDLTIYAGAAYVDGIERALRMRRLRPRRSTDPAMVGFFIAHCDAPLAGLGVGKRLAWFKARRPAAAIAAPPLATATPATRCRSCRKRFDDDAGVRRCAPCAARAEKRAAERAQRTAERQAAAEARRERQIRRDLARRERDRRCDESSRAAMALEAAEQRAGRGSRVPVHCGGWVAADGVLYSSADYGAADRRRFAERLASASEVPA